MATDLERNTATRTPSHRDSDVPVFRAGGIFRPFASPFALLREMTDFMDQAFEGDFPIARGERVWAPAVEVREQDSKLVVSADLPGIEQKDVKVEVNNNTLVIQGERKREQTEEREGFRRSERFYGSFYRAIPLPENAKAENAKADFRNGVLEVTVPLEQQQGNRRQIPIGQSSAQTTQGSQASQTRPK
ncbi:MAG TPA: Hsp20/alpha crystallin family protein [Bryobacteraceae bacterium]|nr:Hsp20/alpha crystallin family protein [Bryobacteraceae bacterium]